MYSQTGYHPNIIPHGKNVRELLVTILGGAKEEKILPFAPEGRVWPEAVCERPLPPGASRSPSIEQKEIRQQIIGLSMKGGSGYPCPLCPQNRWALSQAKKEEDASGLNHFRSFGV